MIRKAVFAALVLSGAALGGSSASAMPFAPVGAPAAQVDLARYGCGPGWHPNRWGRCVPNRRPVWRGRVYRHYDRPVKRRNWERY